METQTVTWREILIFTGVLVILGGTGLALLQFPGGVYGLVIRKTAQFGTWLAERHKLFYLNWMHTYVWTLSGRISYYSLMKLLEQDPEETIRTYMPWVILIFRFIGLVWLGITLWATILFVQILTRGG